MWKQISEYEREILYRGTRLRVEVVPANKSEDTLIDFIIFDALHQPSDGSALLRISGYHAGSLYQILPSASKITGHRGVSLKWLRKHWKKWIPVNGKPKNIWIADKPRRPKASQRT